MIPLRDENPTHRVPFFTIGLIAVSTIVFLYQVSLGSSQEEFVYNYAVLPIEIIRGYNLSISNWIPPYASLLTSMFLHGGLLHLVGNMWFLWIFGDNIEDFLGHLTFLMFYLATGILAAATHIYLNANSDVPTLGASGAISGVLGAYLILHPRIRIKTLIPLGFFTDIVYVPAVFFLVIWFLMQILGGMGTASGVAYGAHIGGFVAGVVLILFFSRRSRAYHPRYESRRDPRWHV